MFPNPQHTPPQSSQSLSHEFVAFPVCGKLAPPEETIAFGLPGMVWAAMPETTIHKNRQSMIPKCEVGFSRQR
jgi:hypothetical protein